MPQKQIITLVVIAVVFGGIGFFGGVKYSQGKSTTKSATIAGQNGQFGGAGGMRQFGQGGRQGGANGGFVAGEILSMDNGSLTLQLPNNQGTKIVLYSDSTSIVKTASGTPQDLKTGETVAVNGTADSSGTITAKTISLGGGLGMAGFFRASTTPPQR